MHQVALLLQDVPVGGEVKFTFQKPARPPDNQQLAPPPPSTDATARQETEPGSASVAAAGGVAAAGSAAGVGGKGAARSANIAKKLAAALAIGEAAMLLTFERARHLAARGCSRMKVWLMSRRRFRRSWRRRPGRRRWPGLRLR